jgi:hypothetical protein
MVNYIVLNVWVSGSSRMVGHLPHHPKVKVLRSVSITGKGREEMLKYIVVNVLVFWLGQQQNGRSFASPS